MRRKRPSELAEAPNWLRGLEKQRAGQVICLKEVEKHAGDLLPPLIARVGAVCEGEIAPPPGKAVTSGIQPIGPQVGAPKQERGQYRSPIRVVVEAGVAVNLVLDKPSYRKSALICVRLRIQAGGSVSGISAAREIRDPHIGTLLHQASHDNPQLCLKLLGFSRERSGGLRVRLFRPDHLNLFRRYARCLQPLPEHLPRL